MAELPLARAVPLIPTGVRVRPLAPAARLSLRGGPEVRAASGAALGFELPASACRASLANSRAALWLGPDEWLLLAEDGEEWAALRAALAQVPHSLVDVSHRQTALAVCGADAPTLLAAGCPLDLDPQAFPVGMCTRTVLAKAQIVLWRTAPETFHLEVWRSFALYVWAFLAEAERGMGAGGTAIGVPAAPLPATLNTLVL
jgi:sarcosine oxidase, subunit gamma